MNKKFVYQVGNNKKVLLWCTANQISRFIKIVEVIHFSPSMHVLWLSFTFCYLVFTFYMYGMWIMCIGLQKSQYLEIF